MTLRDKTVATLSYVFIFVLFNILNWFLPIFTVPLTVALCKRTYQHLYHNKPLRSRRNHLFFLTALSVTATSVEAILSLGGLASWAVGSTSGQMPFSTQLQWAAKINLVLLVFVVVGVFLNVEVSSVLDRLGVLPENPSREVESGLVKARSDAAGKAY